MLLNYYYFNLSFEFKAYFILPIIKILEQCISYLAPFLALLVLYYSYFFLFFNNNLNYYYNLNFTSQNISTSNLLDFSFNWEYTTTLNTIWLLPEFVLISFILYLISCYIFFKLKYTNITHNLILFVSDVTVKFISLLSVLLFVLTWSAFSTNKYLFYKSYILINFFALATKLFVVILFFFLLYFIKLWYLKNQKNILEVYILLLGSLFFIFFLISSVNLFLSYVCLEGLTLQSYVLAIFNFSKISIEVVLKYFLLGSLASAIMLFGISLLYGIFGTLNFIALKDHFIHLFLIDNINISQSTIFTSKICILLIFFGLFFKLGVFPLHIWVPSVYFNSPNPVLVFFAVIIKFIFSIFILRLAFLLFSNFLHFFTFFFILVSIGSIIIGALGAFKELKIKKFIAYTSINQAGFILLGLCCNSGFGFLYSIYYLFIYIILVLGFLNFLFNTQEYYNQRSVIYFSDLKKYYKNNSIICLLFSTYILSFAGLPPFAGFFGKLYLYLALAKSKLFLLLFFVLWINIISLYYYIKILKIIWFENLLNFDNKHTNYRFTAILPLQFLFFLTSSFNIFFIFFADFYEVFVKNYFFSMIFTS